MVRKWTVLIATCGAIVTTSLAACTSSHPPAGPSGSAIRQTTGAAAGKPAGAPGCRPASPIARTKAGFEIRGTGRGATLYGLLMPVKPLPIRSGEQVKIVWRMTGSGPLRLSATNPQDRSVPLQWGPEMHGGSNFNRPGQEWGAGYRFSTAGCWQLHMRRSNATADVWLQVRPS